jgi:hypothetical protein
MRWKSRFLVFFFAAGQTIIGSNRHRGDFVAAIRAELPGSVEKSGVAGSRTNVVFKIAAAGVIPLGDEGGSTWRPRHIALHTPVAGGDGSALAERCEIAPQVPLPRT